MRREPDSIDVAARIACDAHRRGDIEQRDLVDLLEQLIDARAIENGYAERFGLPSGRSLDPRGDHRE